MCECREDLWGVPKNYRYCELYWISKKKLLILMILSDFQANTNDTVGYIRFQTSTE